MSTDCGVCLVISIKGIRASNPHIPLTRLGFPGVNTTRHMPWLTISLSTLDVKRILKVMHDIEASYFYDLVETIKA